MVEQEQLIDRLRTVIDDQIKVFETARSITVVNSIPATTAIPIENQSHWLKIPDVICVFVDMKGSTKLSATAHDRSTAGAYQLFTGTAVRLFDELEAPYIDIKGDGIFALFNQNQPYRALAAAVTFKTFSEQVFQPKIKVKTGLEIGCHIGIDQKTVLVRKIGLKRHADRTDRQNEVWAGKPVNMAAKLAGMPDNNEIIVSDRYFSKITSDLVRLSCGCPGGEKKPLWTEIDISGDPKFDFGKAYLLKTKWCKIHGKEYSQEILSLD